MSGKPELSLTGMVFDVYKATTSSEKRPMLLPYQKTLAVMQRILRKFSKPEPMVVDPCMGTSSTAKAYFMESKHRKFMGCVDGS